MSSIRCAWGLHDDASDVFGGYAEECQRCGRPVRNGATPTARGSLMAVLGVLMILVALVKVPDMGNEIVLVASGAVLFLFGLLVIWRKSP